MPQGDLIITVIIAVVILGMGGFLMLNVASSQGASTYISETSVDIRGGSGPLPQNDYDAVDSLAVAQSLGTSVELTGATDSELSGSIGTDHDRTWAVSVWAQADQNRTQRALQLDGWLYIDLVNGTPDTWRVTYYDEGDLTVHQLSVEASDPLTWTQLVVEANESEMVVYRNNTRAGSTDLSTGGDTIPDADNWDGNIEELRTYDETLNAGVRQTLYDTPTAPTDGNETARVYFDFWSEGSAPSTIPVYWSDASLDSSNATITPGFAGQQTNHGDDWRRLGKTLIVVDNGVLDGAPVAFAKIRYATGSSAFVVRFTSAASSIASILGALVMVIAVGYLLALRQ